MAAFSTSSWSPSSGSAGAPSSSGRSAGRGPCPSRQRIHSSTVGQVERLAVPPTTRPKWPAGNATSKVGAPGAARRMARTARGRAISSRVPTK